MKDVHLVARVKVQIEVFSASSDMLKHGLDAVDAVEGSLWINW